MKRYLVSYDIADPKRLVRVHRMCKNYGIPLQYSVFLMELSRNRLEMLVVELQGVVRGDDDVRIYPLRNHMEGAHVGNTGFPQGAFLGQDANWSAVLEGGERLGEENQTAADG